jgi:HlyD family secretion protein
VAEQQIFRKVALERLASPEQLDQAMRVTTARSWLALAAIGLLLLTAGAWGFVGQLSTKVGGRGILVRSSGIMEIVAPAAGRVSDVAVTVGDSIVEGQVVARVAQPDLFDQVRQAQRELNTLRNTLAQDTAFTRVQTGLELRSLAEQQQNLEQSIAAGESSLRWLQERITSQEQLVEDGLVTRPTLLSTRQQYDQVKEKVQATAHQLSQIRVQRRTVQNKQREVNRNGELRIAQVEAELAQLERQLDEATRVVSPYTGRIVEVMVEQGRIISPGTPLMTLDPTGRTVQDLIAVIYVPSLYGKVVRPGMRMHIAPSTVRQEEYGMMVGQVTYVSSYPATPGGMMRVLKNEQLVNELSANGAPHELRAELLLDPATTSRYRWSSSAGPPMTIESGTMALALVTVDSHRPVTKVVPLLRKWLGIG